MTRTHNNPQCPKCGHRGTKSCARAGWWYCDNPACSLVSWRCTTPGVARPKYRVTAYGDGPVAIGGPQGFFIVPPNIAQELDYLRAAQELIPRITAAMHHRGRSKSF